MEGDAGASSRSARASVRWPRATFLENVAKSSSPAGAPAEDAPDNAAVGGVQFRPRSGRWDVPGAGGTGRFHRRPDAARFRWGGTRRRPVAGAAPSAGAEAEALISERP